MRIPGPPRAWTGLALALLLVGLPAVAQEEASGGANAGSVEAGETADEAAAKPAIHGKHGRRAERLGRLIEGFKADRRAIYEEYGFPSYRHLELDFNIRTEHWYYLSENVEFVFVGDHLVSRQ